MEAFSIATVNFRFHHLRLGESTPLREVNGDVPLDGVSFSRLEWLKWGCIFNRVTRLGSQIFRFLG